jgi:hypothetical protein
VVQFQMRPHLRFFQIFKLSAGKLAQFLEKSESEL